jgi:large subunit ribosomal protein L3
MGTMKTTIQNLPVVKADALNNILLVRGPVPGHKSGYLIIRKAKKTRKKVVPSVPAKGGSAKKV